MLPSDDVRGVLVCVVSLPSPAGFLLLVCEFDPH